MGTPTANAPSAAQTRSRSAPGTCGRSAGNTVEQWARYLGIGLLSAAAMMLELSLTRCFAVAEWYHMAFLSVSVALLGYGISGTLLALRPRRVPRASTLGVALSVAILGAYLVINTVPFDSYQLALDPRQYLYLLVYYAALVVPFAVGGTVIASELAARPDSGHRLYAANLIGSALGGLSLLAILPAAGAPGAIVAAALVAALGGLAMAAAARREPRMVAGWRLPAAAVVGCALILAANPAWLDLRLSPYKDLSYALQAPDARLGFQAWNAYSRVDVVESAQIHAAPGLSLRYGGRLPPQHGLMVDGGDLSPLSRRTEPADGEYLAYLPTSVAYRLRPGAHALILRPRGGADVATALHMGATRVSVVEDNPLVARVVRDAYADHLGGLYDDARVSLAIEDPRAALERSPGGFDVVQLSLAEGFHPLTSGSYSLAENHLYTVEGMAAALRRLNPDGILVVTRWLQDPPSESVRAAGAIVAALERSAAADPARHVIVFRSWSTMTLLASPSPFGQADIDGVAASCEALGYDPVHLQGLSPAQTNRHNVLPQDSYYAAFHDLIYGDREEFYRAQAYDVSPPTDDRPFFGHYFRWRQAPEVLARMGRTWQPFAGSGYLLVLALLVVAVVAAVGLAALPVLAGRAAVAARGRGRILAYFAGLGLGFMLIEVPLMQRFILYLGQPAIAFIVVLSALLSFSGIGSALAPRVSLRGALALLVGLALTYPWMLSRIEAATLAAPLPVRALVAAALLFPLGVLMGVPFACGLRRVERLAPGLTPWIWAVNGGASVVSAILAMVVALALGYRAVLWLAAGSYLAAAVALWPLAAAREATGPAATGAVTGGRP